MNVYDMSFLLPGTNGLGGHSGHCSLHLSHQGNRGLNLSMTLKPMGIGGSGGAIYLPYLVLCLTALSTQKGMSAL